MEIRNFRPSVDVPHDILQAFQMFAQSNMEVERRYKNLSQKIADYLWTQENSIINFENRVAPYGELYVLIITFHDAEPDVIYSDDEESTSFEQARRSLTYYEIYQ